jgi:hypothetical protein
MNTTKHRLTIDRVQHSGLGLSFVVTIGPNSVVLSYSEFQKLLSFGKEFMQSCMACRSVHEWETHDEGIDGALTASAVDCGSSDV